MTTRYYALVLNTRTVDNPFRVFREIRGPGMYRPEALEGSPAIGAVMLAVLAFSSAAHADQPEHLEGFDVYADFTLGGEPASVGAECWQGRRARLGRS